jgi:hypothetical protein
MSKLTWRVGTGEELAKALIQETLQESAAISNATVYRLSGDHRDKIAVSLPDGQVLFIEPDAAGRPRRRRAEPINLDSDL